MKAKKSGSKKIGQEKDQKIFYQSIKKWLEYRGFKTIITGDGHKIVIPISDVLPIRVHAIPDLIGVKNNEVVIVEVETDFSKIFEVIGKCMLWKICATLVYIAYPKEKCKKYKLLEKLGVGLLGVSSNNVEEIVKIMPKESSDLHRVYELHPIDFSKEAEIARLIKNMIEYE